MQIYRIFSLYSENKNNPMIQHTNHIVGRTHFYPWAKETNCLPSSLRLLSWMTFFTFFDNVKSTSSVWKIGLYLSANDLDFLYPMTQSRNSLVLASTKESLEILKKSIKIGTARNIVLIGMVKLNMVAKPNIPPPRAKPSFGMGMLWSKVLL